MESSRDGSPVSSGFPRSDSGESCPSAGWPFTPSQSPHFPCPPHTWPSPLPLPPPFTVPSPILLPLQLIPSRQTKPTNPIPAGPGHLQSRPLLTLLVSYSLPQPAPVLPRQSRMGLRSRGCPLLLRQYPEQWAPNSAGVRRCCSNIQKKSYEQFRDKEETLVGAQCPKSSYCRVFCTFL